MILEKIAKQFMGRGIDKKFPFLVWLYKKIYTRFSSSGEVEVLIPLNSKLLVSKKDSGLGLMLRTSGKFEPLQTKNFIKSVKKGDVFFDIGANVGYYSVLASKLVGKGGQVFAFEPDPQNLKLLQKNLDLNDCKNVTVVSAALGFKKGRTILTQDISNPGESSVSRQKTGNKISVPVITLDQFVKSRKIKKIDLIKIDVEGAELDVLRGGLGILQDSANIKIFIECNPTALKDFNESRISLCAFLIGLEFKIDGIIDEKSKKIFKYSNSRLDEILKVTGFTNLIATKHKKVVIDPKVSVLMAAYNSEKYVGDAIESILHQTYNNFEFIIVDDKSTDNTLEIIKSYAKKDRRIKVVSLEKKLGPSLAANAGLNFVTGDYLVRMDADDISKIDRLERQLTYIKNNPETSMVGGQCVLIDHKGLVIGKKTFPLDNKSIYNSLFSRNPIQHPACMINLNNMTKHAILHDGKSVLAHDLELVFLASKFGKLANIDKYVLQYRQYPTSFSLVNPKKTFWQTLKVRLESISKYRYVPTFVGMLTTLAQIAFVFLVPNKLIYPIYSYVRGMRKINLSGVRIKLYVPNFFKKAYQLATS